MDCDIFYDRGLCIWPSSFTFFLRFWFFSWKSAGVTPGRYAGGQGWDTRSWCRKNKISACNVLEFRSARYPKWKLKVQPNCQSLSFSSVDLRLDLLKPRDLETHGARGHTSERSGVTKEFSNHIRAEESRRKTNPRKIIKILCTFLKLLTIHQNQTKKLIPPRYMTFF